VAVLAADYSDAVAAINQITPREAEERREAVLVLLPSLVYSQTEGGDAVEHLFRSWAAARPTTVQHYAQLRARQATAAAAMEAEAAVEANAAKEEAAAEAEAEAVPVIIRMPAHRGHDLDNKAPAAGRGGAEVDAAAAADGSYLAHRGARVAERHEAAMRQAYGNHWLDGDRT